MTFIYRFSWKVTFFKAKKVGNPAVFLLPRSVSLALHEVHYAAVNNPPAPDISLSQIIFLHQTARLKLLRLPPATLLQPTVAFPEELRWEQWETSPFLHPPLSRLLSPIQKEVFPFRSCSRSAVTDKWSLTRSTLIGRMRKTHLLFRSLFYFWYEALQLLDNESFSL